MFSRFKRASKVEATAQNLYGAVVAGARDPAFYSQLSVPDTPDGRYEMLVLHLFLMAERIRAVPASDELERLTIEAFVTDFDDNMREMGVGDIVVHRKVKKATAGLFERSLAYRTALSEPSNESLISALGDNIPDLKSAPRSTLQIAETVRSRAAALAATPDNAILTGTVMFVPVLLVS